METKTGSRQNNMDQQIGEYTCLDIGRRDFHVATILWTWKYKLRFVGFEICRRRHRCWCCLWSSFWIRKLFSLCIHTRNDSALWIIIIIMIIKFRRTGISAVVVCYRIMSSRPANKHWIQRKTQMFPRMFYRCRILLMEFIKKIITSARQLRSVYFIREDTQVVVTSALSS